MHDEIKKFSLSGELGEPNIVDTKERLVWHIESMMRDYGYVPSIDLEPQFTLDYDDVAGGFNFELSVYGVKVGKDNAWEISGVSNGKLMKKYTPQSK